MGLIEIIGEFISPGRRGTIHITKRNNERRIGILILKTILSLAMIAVVYYLVFGKSFQIKGFLLFVAIVAVYSASGYYIAPKPDYSNVGWLGGLLDNPFKISDDINRFLIFFIVILIPGRLIATTVLSWFHLIKK